MTEKYKLISNDPIGKDLFESKGQEKTAAIIANNIDNEKFKVIGIDGGWGSGKSNLVKILEGKLPKHCFFVYDVWGHQEDEQRKAILTELTDFIIDKEIVRNCNEKKWDEKLETLLANRKKTTTINIPYLSVGFIFSLLSIIYIPSVNVFKDTLVDFFNIDALFWKLILVFAPIIIVIAIYVYYLFSFWIQKKGFRASFKLSAQETFQIYSNKQKTDTKIETISENQPSVREFRNWMNDIDKDIKEKKLIIVFDNFDRLPKKQILSIWSVIHVFFSETKYKNIKIIVPFDRAHINNAFKELNSSSGKNENNNKEDYNSTEDNYANDYINKTFDIVFRVAPPILSSWKSFFEEKWQEAFSENYNIEEYLKSLQAYEVLRPVITPREIIAFINEVVALKLIDETIPNRYISIFVLKKEDIIKDPLKAVIDLSYLDGLEHSYKTDPDYQKYITALAYQIEAGRALEVVYRNDLKNSLMNKNVETIDKISKTTVFSKILHSIILELSSYENAIEALDLLSEDANISNEELEIVWDDIYLRQRDKKQESGELESFQTVLLKRVGPLRKTDCLVRIVMNLYSEQNGLNIPNLINNIDKLNTFCSNNNVGIDVFQYLFEKNINIDEYKALIDKKGKEYIKYKLTCPKNTIINYLKEVTSEKLKFHEFVFHLDYKYELDDFRELIKTFIAENSDDLEYIQYALFFLKNISKEPMGNILTNSDLYSLVGETDIENELFVDLAAMILMFGNKSNPSYIPSYGKALDIVDKEFHGKVAREIDHYATLDQILINSIDFQNNLMQGVVPLLFGVKNEKRNLYINKVIENFTAIVEANKIDAETIFYEIDQYEFEENLDYVFIKDLNVKLFMFAKESNSNIAKYLISIYLNHFKKPDNKIWKVVFSNLDSKELSILLSLNFKDWNSFALENFKIKLLDISNNNDTNISRIPSLIDSFEKSNQNLMLAFIDMRESYISNNQISNEHFSMFMPYLFKYGKLEDKPADVIRTIFKTAFLDNPDCVKVMIEYSNYIRSILDKCEKSEKIDFISAIKDRSEYEQISKLAEKLNLNIEKPKMAKK